ncbi:hypothetical protein AAY473_002056 [Plecturocebus cupreus]
MKPWNLQNCFVSWRPMNLHLKTSLWSFSNVNKCEHKEEKQLLKATTSSDHHSCANHIAKAKKPFTLGEELILPAKDICCKLLGEATVRKVVHVPL